MDCPYCLTETKLLANKILGVTNTPKRELHTIHCDHTYMPVRSRTGMKYMVTIIDHFSKFLTVVPTKTLTMARFTQILTQYLLQYPQIREVKFDNAFNSTEVFKTCENFGVLPILTASHNSRENSVERAHRTLKEKIEIFMAQKRLSADEWHLSLSESVTSINTSPHSTTGLTPFEIVFNQPANLYDLDDDTYATPEKIEQRQYVYRRIMEAKRAQSEKTKNPLKEIPSLSPGTLIIVRYGPRNPKFFATVLTDHGMTLTVRRTEIGEKSAQKQRNQHGTIKVAKRHVYIPKKNSFEITQGHIASSLIP